MKEWRDILALNSKTLLLMEVSSHCWLRTTLQRVQCIFIILRKYLNKHCTEAAVLIRGRRLLTFRPHVRRLIEGGAYLEVALIWVNTVLGYSPVSAGLVPSLVPSLWEKIFILIGVIYFDHSNLEKIPFDLELSMKIQLCKVRSDIVTWCACNSCFAWQDFFEGCNKQSNLDCACVNSVISGYQTRPWPSIWHCVTRDQLLVESWESLTEDPRH